MKIIIVCLIAMLTTAAWAEEGRHFMEESEKVTKSHTEKTLYRLEILDSDGKLVQARNMEFFYKRQVNKELVLIKFISPPILQGTGLLIEDTDKEANDIWLYLPATRKLRRIAGGEKTNLFMGTEFTHEDFEDYKINLYRFQFVKETSCGAMLCSVVAAEPENPREREASGYARKLYYIDKQSQYPVMIEYFGHNGSLIKRLTASGLTRQGNYWRPRTLEMANLENRRVTRLIMQSRELDGELNDYYVSSRYLRAD